MSRIGKLPISIPAGVTVNVSDKNKVTVKGPKGSLERQIDQDITIIIENNEIVLERPTESKRHKAIHGLYRSLINNMVVGVSQGFSTKQELVGVGYRAGNKGQLLELSLGFSHDIIMEIPAEIKITTETVKGKNPTIQLESADNELLGMVAAKIRSFRKPEPYKGKGIRFENEVIRRKAGKSASSKK